MLRENIDDDLHRLYLCRTCLLLSNAVKESQQRSDPVDIETRNYLRQLLPHIKYCLQQADIVGGRDLGWGYLAHLCVDHGCYDEAIRLFTLDLAFLTHPSEQLADNSRQVQSLLGLSFVLLQQGNLRIVEEKARSAVFQLQTVNEDWSNELRLPALQPLARILTAADNFDEAEKIYQEVLESQEKNLGLNDLTTLKTLSRLASSWLEKDDCYGPAEMLYRRLATSYTKLFGLDHFMTFAANLDLALIFEEQGKYSEAEYIYNDTLKAFEMKLGLDHPNTLKVIARLAVVADVQGHFAKAANLFEQALSGMKQSMGDCHPVVLKVEENVALSFRLRGECKEARKRYVEILRTMKNNPSTYTEEAIHKTFSKLLDMYREADLPWEDVEGLKN